MFSASRRNLSFHGGIVVDMLLWMSATCSSMPPPGVRVDEDVGTLVIVVDFQAAQLECSTVGSPPTPVVRCPLHKCSRSL